MPQDPKLPAGITTVPTDIQARVRGDVRPPQQFGRMPMVLSVHLPWVMPIPDSQEIAVLGYEDTTGVGDTGTIANTEYTLGQGNIGVLRSFSVYIDDMTTATDVTFSLRINGAPAPGYGAIKMFPRLAASVSNSFDCMLILPVKAKVEVVFLNTDGGAYKVGAGFNGWEHPELSARRWMLQGPAGFGI